MDCPWSASLSSVAAIMPKRKSTCQRIWGRFTSAFASSAPFDSKNMLADFEINLEGIEEKGLWLVANYYTAKAEYREGATDIPAARRSRGWRFLLATADEAKDLCDVTVDAETLIARICDSVCNMREFESAALMGIGASNDGYSSESQSSMCTWLAS